MLSFACRNDARPTPPDATDGVPPTRSDTITSEDAAVPEPALAADAEVERRPDAGASTGCSGARITLLGAALDPRCAITEKDWNARVRPSSRGDDVKVESALRQELRREGDSVVLSLVNGSKAMVSVPLRFHPSHPELAFSVLAEAKDAGIFELEPPGNDAPPPTLPPPVQPAHGPKVDLGDAGTPFYVHHALIRLPPGGSAEAHLRIDARVVRRLDRECRAADAGSCLPARLAKGRVVLHVGQLVAPTAAQTPTRIEWDAP